MNSFNRQFLVFGATIFFAVALFSSVGRLAAQAPWPPGAVPTPNDQRNSQRLVKSEVQWLQNATRTAPNYGTGGYANVRAQFEKLCAVYSNFKQTLSPRQLDFGGNDLAELDAGLGIIQEAFSVYENDVANGRSISTALRSMCQVLSQASALWLQEFNRVCTRMRVGFP